MGPRFRGGDHRCWNELTYPSRRTGPVLQRRPDPAREAEAIDRGRRAQGLEAVQLDAAPLEAAFLQDVARRGVGDAGAGEQVFELVLLEEEVDRRACGLGGKTLAPMVDAKPIAELRRVRIAPVDADHADRRVMMFDQERQIAAVGRYRAHESDG